MHRSTLTRTLLLASALCALLLALAAGSALAGHGQATPVKKGILLVAFGTTVPEAQAAMDNIDEAVRAAFPDVPVRWAYTSRIVRHKLAEEGRHIDSPAQALAGMMDHGFTHVAVQSLHTIPGQEYHDLVRTARAFAEMGHGPARVLVGRPLLATSRDLDAAAQAVLETLPEERAEGEAVVLLGHGTHHPADVYYAALQYALWKRDPNVFVGTVEGTPTYEDVLAELKKRGLANAWLLPFMSVAGDHARNDMAGPGEDSWMSMLQNEGVACSTVLKGTAEYDAFVELWVDHLQAAFGHFQ